MRQGTMLTSSAFGAIQGCGFSEGDIRIEGCKKGWKSFAIMRDFNPAVGNGREIHIIFEEFRYAEVGDGLWM